MAGRLRHLDDTADLDDGLALSDHLFGGLELADDLLRCVLVPFMVKSPAQSGRLMTLIHPGQTSGVDVMSTADAWRQGSVPRLTGQRPMLAMNQIA